MDRFDKLEKVEALYLDRKSQEQIAERLNMAKEDVGKCMRKLNFWHTVRQNPNYKKNSQAIILNDDLAFLDKYIF